MSQENKDENIGDVPQAPMVVHKQYLKDMSFENPNAPQILKVINNRPEMDMNIMLDVQKIEDDKIENFYEVSMTLTTTAKRDDQTMFIAEIVYGAAVSIYGLNEKQHHMVLFIEVPQLIYPYARQLLSNSTQAGGYMPLMPNPVDFRAMYLQRFGQPQKENAEAETA